MKKKLELNNTEKKALIKLSGALDFMKSYGDNNIETYFKYGSVVILFRVTIEDPNNQNRLAIKTWAMVEGADDTFYYSIKRIETSEGELIDYEDNNASLRFTTCELELARVFDSEINKAIMKNKDKYVAI